MSDIQLVSSTVSSACSFLRKVTVTAANTLFEKIFVIVWRFVTWGYLYNYYI